jgi:hypothetical protein
VEDGRAIESHDGAFMGYEASILRYLDDHLTVSVLCNTTKANAPGLGEKVAAVFLPEHHGPPAASAAGAAPFGVDLASVEGSYVDRSGADVRILDVSEGTVHVRYGRSHEPPRELVPVGSRDLQVKGGRTHYRFTPADGKRPARLTRLSRSAPPEEFVREDLVSHVDRLADYEGRYGSDELPRDLEIRIADGALVAGPVGGAARTAPFTPVARDLFAAGHAGDTDSIGWRFERDARGRIARLVVSDDRAREVVLRRR